MKLKTLAAALLVCACAVPAMADGYNRVELSYELETLTPSAGESTSLNGFGVAYTHGFGLTPKIPLYLETGVKLAPLFWSKSEGNVTNSMNVAYLAVPVNVVYQWKIGNGFTVAPYLGLNFKANVSANRKTKWSNGGSTGSNSTNLLKGDNSANAFQIGWHIGAGVYYHSFYLGIGGGTDFIQFASDVNSGNMSISLGYCF